MELLFGPVCFHFGASFWSFLESLSGFENEGMDLTLLYSYLNERNLSLVKPMAIVLQNSINHSLIKEKTNFLGFEFSPWIVLSSAEVDISA